MKLRQDADYSAEIVFTSTTATDELASAHTFVEAVRAILSDGGWLERDGDVGAGPAR